MSQPYAAPTNITYETPEEKRIRRLLAYKSLILSILQRSIVFLVIAAIIVAAIVLYVIYRHQQKDPHRWKTQATLIYGDTISKEKIRLLPVDTVVHVISAREYKIKAAQSLEGFQEEKMGLLDEGIKISYDRNSPNMLTLNIGWDDKDQAVALAQAYADQVTLAYSKYRQDQLLRTQKEIKKQETQKQADIKTIDVKLRELTADLAASTIDQELDRLKQQLYTLEETLSDLNKQHNVENLKIKSMTETINSVNLLALKNYQYIMSLIREKNLKVEQEAQMRLKYTERMIEVQKAIAERKRAEKILEKALQDNKVPSEEAFFALDSAVNTERDLKDAKLRLASLDQYLSSTKEGILEVKKRIKEVEDRVPRETELKDNRSKLEDTIKLINAEINDAETSLSTVNQELRVLSKAISAGNANALTAKQYLVSMFVGGLFATMLAFIVILLGAQFGCISTEAEFRDLAEIEVFSLSESKLKKYDEAHLQEFVHNIFYALNQIIEEKRFLFFGALRGSFSTTLFFEQLLLQFAMNGTRIFVLNLEPYNIGSQEGNGIAAGTSASEEEDPIAEDLLGVEKNGDVGLFKLGNANFISPNEREILNMDIDTLLKHYDKIIFKREAPFSGKELIHKQVISFTKCCLFSVGKKRSPRSFLKFIRDTLDRDEETIITGLFTEP